MHIRNFINNTLVGADRPVDHSVSTDSFCFLGKEEIQDEKFPFHRFIELKARIEHYDI